MTNNENKRPNFRSHPILDQIKNKIHLFKLRKQFSKQLCDSIALGIEGESILIFNTLEIFFTQIIKILQRSIRSTHIKIKDYINVEYNLKTIYFAIQKKLLLLKEIPNFQKNKEKYLQNFSTALKLVKLVKQLKRKQILKQFQIFNGSNFSDSYKSDKDKITQNYLKIKLAQSQRANSLQNNLKQKLLGLQFPFLKFFKNIQRNYNNQILQRQCGVHQNVSKSNCIMCSPFYIYDVNITIEKTLSSDIVLFESVKKMRDVEQSKIKQQIVAFCNSDRPGIIQFDCFQNGLQILPRGFYMTERSKQSYEQTFSSLVDSIEPKLQINKDYKIQFVPVKQTKKEQFLHGVYVMRIKIAPSRVSQSKLFKCKIDGKSYCYVRQGKKNIKLSQKSMQECYSLKRASQYSLMSSDILRCQRYVPQNFHYGTCCQPQKGNIQYQYNKVHADYFMNLLNHRIELQSETGTALENYVLLVAGSNWKQPLHKQFQQLGIKNIIQNLYKKQFKIAQSTLVMKYDGKYENIQDAVEGEHAKKKNYFRIGNRPIITIHVCDYLKIKNYQLSLKQIQIIKAQIQRLNLPTKDFKIWKDSLTQEIYINSQQKNVLIYLYLRFKQEFKKMKKMNNLSEINFKNPEWTNRLIEFKDQKINM